MNRWICLVLCCLLAALSAGILFGCSGDSPAKPGAPAEFTLLADTGTFYIGGPDLSGAVYPAVSAFRTLIVHEEADRWFKELSGQEGSPSMIYGFAGMYWTDPDSLGQVIFDYLEDDRYVAVQAHGQVYSQKISDLVAQIAQGLLTVELNGGPLN